MEECYAPNVYVVDRDHLRMLDLKLHTGCLIASEKGLREVEGQKFHRTINLNTFVAVES